MNKKILSQIVNIFYPSVLTFVNVLGAQKPVSVRQFL